MQFNDEDYIQKRWGNKPCTHPDLDKEYYLGTQTGDYVCTTCGKSGSYESLRAEGDKAKNDNKT